MEFNELRQLVEQMVTEAPKDPLKQAQKGIEWYFKELGGDWLDSEGFEGYDYIPAKQFKRDGMKKILARAPNIEKNNINLAWNKMVDDGSIWYHKEPADAEAYGGEAIYTFASNDDERKKLEDLLAPRGAKLQKPSKDTPEKIAPKATSGGGGKCKSVSPPAAAMRFEWCVIESARMAVDAPVGTGNPAYSCARSDDWRQMKHGGSTIGALADKAIALCVKSGFFSKANFAGASMEKVGKKKPAWGGPAIEPKTDMRFGDKNISLKLSGDIQAASPEAAGASKQLQFVMDEWLKENAEVSVKDAAIKAAQEETAELFAQAKEAMIKNAKAQLITHNRAQGLMKDIQSYYDILNNPEWVNKKGKPASDADKKKAEKKIPKYEAAIKSLQEQGIVNQVGDIIIKEFDYDTWQEKFGNDIRDKLKEIFTKTVKPTTEGPQAASSLRNVLVDELLSGRRIFEHEPLAIAQYIVSPDHVFSLVETDGGAYAKTIATFAKIIKVDVRSKGGRGVTDDGRLAEIGCKPSYRFDIRGKDIENAFKEVEQEIAKASLQKEADDPLPDQSGEGKVDIETFEKEISATIDKLEAKLTKEMVSSLNIEETVESMTDFGEQKEHLTKTPLSYTMLREMIENLMSEE